MKNKYLFQIVAKTIGKLGVALKHPEVGPIIDDFKRSFFPKIKDLRKSVNIAVAESLDEEGDPLSRRQQSQKKGVARKGAGAYVYVKKIGNKDPLLVRTLAANMVKALQNPTEDEMLNAFAQAGSMIKDPAKRKAYEDGIEKELMTNPERRAKIYGENLAALVQSISKLANDSLEQAMAAKDAYNPKQPRRKLPEEIENKIVDNITEAIINFKAKKQRVK